MPRRKPLAEVGEAPDPRFSLANERTFLAWNRTALALIAGGLAVTQLLPETAVPGLRRVLGVLLIALGAVLSFFSYRHWDDVERALRTGAALPRSRLPQVLAAAIGVAAVGATVLELAG
jgi:putative membrane protein